MASFGGKGGSARNNSERKAIDSLKEYLPEQYVIFHNLELPDQQGRSPEIDLIVVGEYAVYLIEVKGYGGEINGNHINWELSSGKIELSPVPKTNENAKILATLLQKSLFPNRVWVQPLIVLTNRHAKVRLKDNQANIVLHLDEAVSYILDPTKLPIQHPESISSELNKKICTAILSQSRPLTPQNQIGDYRILSKPIINKNNFYRTLLAEHLLIQTRNRFILKVYNFDILAKQETRHRQENLIRRDANALYQLSGHRHPNIVRANPPFLWEDNQFVLPLEWIDGYSLRGLLDDGTEIDFKRKVDIISQISEGLRHAHSQGVIHRDVRPDNIIIPYNGAIKLVNFDLARIEADNISSIGNQIGRRLDQRYAAPELWMNAGDASPASDQYALGTAFFELLTGRPAYDKIGDMFTAKHLPRRATEMNPNLPRGVDEVLARMCAFKPVERYSNMDEVLYYLKIIDS